MFDFTWSNHTIGNVLYCTITYLLFVLLFYKKYVKYALCQEHKSNQWLMVTALILIITACIDGDWFHYREIVKNYDYTIGAHNHGEPVYAYIISFVKKNYLLFRIVVWGGAFGLTIFTFKRFEININTAIFFLVAVFLVKFNYSRTTLGMACYFLGLSFLLKPIKNHELLNCIFVGLFFWGGYEFHHSIFLLLLITVVAYLPMEKPLVVIVLLVLLPLFASIFNDSLFLVDQLENEYISNKLNNYIERDTGPSNIYGKIAGIISYGAFVLPIIMDMIVISKNNKTIALSIKRLYRITIFTSMLALMFAFMGLESTVFIYRILFMTMIPLTILTVYLYENKLMSLKQFSIIVSWGIFAISYKLLHQIYLYR